VVVPDDPATEAERLRVAADAGDQPASRRDAAHRRKQVLLAGHQEDARAARAGLADPDDTVRLGALGALARMGKAESADVTEGLRDRSPKVRRRACEVATGLRGTRTSSVIEEALRAALDDPDPLVVDSACFALGELSDRGAVGALDRTSRQHPDTRCREAAVAALGAIGDPAGLAAVLDRLEDKPTVRRRAVVALAAFGGSEVESALRRCLEDRDWQVRQAAEILLED
jgi:HEAT repeat protein